MSAAPLPLPLLDSCSFCERTLAEVMYLMRHKAAAICGDCLGQAMAAWKDRVYYAQRRIGAPPGAPAPPPVSAAYTGDCCNDCGNFRMVRSGTCVLCLDCGRSSECN